MFLYLLTYIRVSSRSCRFSFFVSKTKVLADAPLPEFCAAAAGLRPLQTCNNELALAIESRARMPFVGSAVVPHVAAASSLLRATAPASLIVLRGGASVGPIKMGPISVDLLLGPGGCAAASPSHACVYCSWTPNAYTHSHSPSHSDRNALTQPLRLALHGRYSWPEPLRPVPVLHARCVVLNAVAGLFYAMSLVGFDPNMPDPTLK